MNATQSIRLLAVAALVLGVSQTHAAERTWADSTGNTSFFSNASWVDGVAPANNTTTDTAVFTSVSNAQPALTLLSRIAGIDFQMAAGGLTMNGNNFDFQVGAGGIDSTGQTSGTNTITNANIKAFSSDQTWSFFSSANTTSTSTFTVDSPIELGRNLTIIGQRNSAAGNVGIINFEEAILAGSAVRTVTINSTSANNTVNLNGQNTYLGVTNVNGGIVNVSGDQSAATGGWSIVTPDTAGVPVATVNFLSGSTIEVDAANKIQIGRAANSGESFASTLNVAGTVNNDGTLQMERASTLNLNNGAVWNQAGNMVITARGGTQATFNINAGAEMTYTGTSTVQLNRAANSGGVGGLFIDSSGVFTTGRGFEATVNTGDPANGNGRVSLTNGGTLKLSGNVTDLSTEVHFELGTGGGVIDNNGFNATLSGVVTGLYGINRTGITGTGGLTSTGGGTLTLSGDNTYTGATLVSAGTLLVSATGSIATSAGFVVGTNGTLDVSANGLTVGSGKFVGGDGLIEGDLSLASGALFAFNMANTLTLDAGSIFSLDSSFGVASLRDLSGNALNWDSINVGEYTLLTGGNIGANFFNANNITNFGLSNAVTGLGTGGTKSAYFDNGSLQLVVIPEPSTWALLGIGVATLAVFRRRRA